MDVYTRFYALSRHEKGTTAALFALCFALGLAVVLVVGVVYARSALRAEVAEQVAGFNAYEANIANTFQQMQTNSSAVPCSDVYLNWLRRIAFLPDGVNELMYTENGVIQCSVNNGRFERPIDLGVPDVTNTRPAIEMWLDRDLVLMDLPGLTGTYIKSGQFMLVAPGMEYTGQAPSWLHYEYVTRSDNDEWWHRAGETLLLFNYHELGRPLFDPASFTFYAWGCSNLGVTCIIASAPLAEVVRAGLLPLAGAFVLAGLLALAAAVMLKERIRRLWAFPTRFVRTLDDSNLVCHYQPLLSLRTGRITGVEVLSRWQDMDGSLVFPDKFLPVVENKNLTRTFTQLMVNRAFAELSKLETDGPLQVNFNIFPRDFNADWLLEVFADFRAHADRFQVVVELVETDQIPVEESREMIAQLREGGIRTFIDDFGVGYSSIHYLAGLEADGVKLDRAFAMAPDGTLMATMLNSAIEMIRKTGQEMLVEGVETEGRLRALKATNMVDSVQGYHISRPLALAPLSRFLREFTEAQVLPEQPDAPVRLSRT